MLKHLFTTAWRKLYHNKTYTLIHLSGLVLGISSCLILASYLVTEFGCDRFHKDAERIYRVNTDLILPGQHLELSLTSGLVGPGLKRDFPGVESFVRISKPPNSLAFRENEKVFGEKEVIYADSSFFTFFSFPLLEGNPHEVLRSAQEVVLTKSAARKYFGDTSPVGRVLMIDNIPFKITGIVSDPPANSQIRFNAVISYQTWLKAFPYTEENWSWHPATTYIRLKPGTSPADLSNQLNEWRKAKTGNSREEEKTILSLEAFVRVHLGQARLGDLSPVGSRTQLFLMAGTALFILLIAIFNYINLATAETAGREKEIGVRKALGAGKTQILSQFLAESILLFTLAFLVSLLLTKMMLPLFSIQVDRAIDLNLFAPKYLLPLFVLIILLLAPVSSMYPALLLSRRQVAGIFRQGGWSAPGKLSLKKILITVQFIVSMGLIISTLVIWQQHHYLENRSMGFARENKLVIRTGNPGNLAHSPELIKQQIIKLPGIRSVSLSSHVPGEKPHGVSTSVRKADGSESVSELELNLVDFDYIDQYGLQLIAGRKFSREFASDTIGALIVNETALHLLGFAKPADILEKDFTQWGRSGKVIGVVKDFNQHSLQTAITPLSFQVNPALFERITIGYESNSFNQVLNGLEQNWTNLAGEVPLDYFFLDDWIRAQYLQEKRFSNLFIGFTLLAICIACLGIYGLTKSALGKRVKEIGIRKVLGSSVFDMVRLFSNEMAWLTIIALLIASPISWWLVNHWLDQFAYRISISWWVFGVAGGIVCGITFLTVSTLTIRAAHANPVKSLRTE